MFEINYQFSLHSDGLYPASLSYKVRALAALTYLLAKGLRSLGTCQNQLLLDILSIIRYPCFHGRSTTISRYP